MIDPAGLASVATLANLPLLARRLLDDFAGYLLGQGLEVPGRQYRAPGSSLAWDAEQLTVLLVGVYRGQPGSGLAAVEPVAQLTQYAVFDLVLVREVPALDEGQPDLVPADADVDAAGAAAMEDYSACWTAAVAMVAAYQQAAGRVASVDQVTPQGPMGGLAGVSVRMSVVLT